MNTSNTQPSSSPPPPVYRIENQITPIKLEINNLIWMFGPPGMTLMEAEELAGEMLTKALQAFRKHDNSNV